MRRETSGISLNEDSSHYFGTRSGQDLSGQAVDSWVDQYAGTQVRELFLCPNCMRTSYASEVWEPIWTGYDPASGDDQPLLASTPEAGHEAARGWIHTAWLLHQKGIDPYARWIARCRQVGISPWLSMRMNDIHNVDDPDSYIHSSFWREHPELRRVPYRDRPENWRDRALDYGRQEVRDYHMALVRELAERYDVDGIELDWMRFGYHFRPGHEAAGREILTDWIGEVRQLLDSRARERGHQIKLGARVPSRPGAAWGLGMDAGEWAHRGLIDMLVVTPFFSTADTDIPLELWRRLLAGTEVTLAAGIEVLVRPYPSYPEQRNSLETVRGMATSFLDRGVDRIYLFNYMDSDTAMEGLVNYPTLLREVGSRDTLAGKPRRHVVTYADTWPPGEPQPTLLPADCAAGDNAAFRVHTGPRPESGRAMVVLGLHEECAACELSLTVRLNGAQCSAAGPIELPRPCPSFPTYAFDVPISAVLRGHNLVEVAASRACTVGWVEISIGG